MPVYFDFVSTDDQVTDTTHGLSATEINAVTTWQDINLDYNFSFHEQHEAGHPLYICKATGHGQRLMPKVDLKDKQTRELRMVNPSKLLTTQRKDAIKVIVANLAAFQKLARLYYEGIPEVTTTTTTVVSVTCKGCNKEIGYVALNGSGKRVCPKCKKWN